VIDDFLVGELGVDAAMQRLIPDDGSGIFLTAFEHRSHIHENAEEVGQHKDPTFPHVGKHGNVQKLLPRH